MWKFLRNRRLILRLHYFQDTHILGASRGGPCDSGIMYVNLTDFYWLWLYQPVRAGIQYKIALCLTFKIYTSTHPSSNYPTYGTSIPNVITPSQLQRPLSTSRLSRRWGQDCFSAVGRSATPLQQFGTHYLLISLIILTENEHLPPSPDNCHLGQLPP